jgi:superoxide dismutase
MGATGPIGPLNNDPSMPYAEQTFNLPEMTGLSAKQIEAHLKLYAGYVKNVNAVAAKIDEYKKDAETHAIALSELTRRYAFEWNGMRLHELYFASLGGDGTITGSLADTLATQYGSIDGWKATVPRIRSGTSGFPIMNLATSPAAKSSLPSMCGNMLTSSTISQRNAQTMSPPCSRM